jgi:hypothetical protein
MRAAFLALAGAALILVACGGDGDDTENGDDGPSGSEAPFMSTAGPALTDTEYVAALCEGVEEYTDALNTKGLEELREARAKLEADTRALHPPEGAEDFQREYVAYLETAESDPTLLAVTPPPLPDGDLQVRLAAAAADIGCAIPLFAGGESPSPTPGG